MKQYALVLVFFLLVRLDAQTISTIAGGGGIGNGITALTANLNLPYAAITDKQGNCYIADYGNNCIRKVNATTKLITTIAGNDSAGYSGDGALAINAKLNGPSGIALDSIGNLYIADQLNNCIRFVSASSGIIYTIAGNGNPGSGGDGGPAVNGLLNNPTSIAINKVGNLFISDTYNNTIRKIDLHTNIIYTVAGSDSLQGFYGDGGLADTAQFSNPTGLTFDQSGNLYVADTYNYRIRKINVTNGVISTVAGNGSTDGYSGDGHPADSASLNLPQGLAVDFAGNTYIADTYNNRIRKIAASTNIISTIAGNGTTGFIGDSIAATFAALNFPTSVYLDTSNNLYIADTYNQRIRVINQQTNYITTLAGNGSISYSGDGAMATFSNLWGPQGIASDTAGNLYISDTQNNRIRKINATSGIITTLAGNGLQGFSGNGTQAIAATLNNPNGIAVDQRGNVYFCDQNNHCIREVVDSSASIITIAGTGVAGYTGDGDTASLAQLNSPAGIAIDASGNLFIADEGNSCIRKITFSPYSPPIISTVAGTGAAGYAGNGSLATLSQLYSPTGVAVDNSGNLYIADQGNSSIRVVSGATGSITSIDSLAIAANNWSPTGIFVSANGTIYFSSDFNSNSVTAIAGDLTSTSVLIGTGTAGFSGDGGLPSMAQLNNPNGLTFDKWGNFYVADAGNNRIRKITNLPSSIKTLTPNSLFLKYYPNPVSSTVMVTTDPNVIEELQLIDAQGNTIQTNYVKAEITTINVAALAPGIYYLRAIGQTATTTEKLVVIH